MWTAYVGSFHHSNQIIFQFVFAPLSNYTIVRLKLLNFFFQASEIHCYLLHAIRYVDNTLLMHLFETIRNGYGKKEIIAGGIFDWKMIKLKLRTFVSPRRLSRPVYANMFVNSYFNCRVKHSPLQIGITCLTSICYTTAENGMHALHYDKLNRSFTIYTLKQ